MPQKIEELPRIHELRTNKIFHLFFNSCIRGDSFLFNSSLIRASVA